MWRSGEHGWDWRVSWGQAVERCDAMLARTVGICWAWLVGGWITEVRKIRQCGCLESCTSLLSLSFSE